MPDPARDHVVSWWNEAWRSGLWAASWEKSIADLSAAQAAWSPATPGVTAAPNRCRGTNLDRPVLPVIRG